MRAVRPHSPPFPRAVPLTSGAVCAAAQVTRGQLRVYAREGLIPPPRRTDGGFRDYPADTVARLQAIRHSKAPAPAPLRPQGPLERPEAAQAPFGGGRHTRALEPRRGRPARPP